MFNIEMLQLEESFTVKQMCELLAGEYPYDDESLSKDQRAFFQIITNAITQGALGDNSTREHLKRTVSSAGSIVVYAGSGETKETSYESEALQIIISKDEWRRWLSKKGVCPEFLQHPGSPTSPSLPDTLDSSIVSRLQAMIDAANKYWKGKQPGDDDIPVNKAIAAEIEDQCGVSHTLAVSMASIIRPDWAKNRTWRDNKKR